MKSNTVFKICLVIITLAICYLAPKINYLNEHPGPASVTCKTTYSDTARFVNVLQTNDKRGRLTGCEIIMPLRVTK